MKTPAHCFTALCLACLPLAAQDPTPDPKDPFVRGQAPGVNQLQRAPKLISVSVETFSLDMADAAALYREAPTDAKLYQEITARVAKGKAKLEGMMIARARSGERAVVESVSETIYPADYTHGNGPTPTQPPPSDPKNGTKPATNPSDTPGSTAAAPAGYFAPVLPTSFQTRNVGTTLEIEPTLGADDSFVDLRISPQIVSQVQRASWGQGVSETEVPVFETQRMETAGTLTPGQPYLLGTLSRPPGSKVDPDAAPRIWLAFATPKLVYAMKE